MFNACMPLLSVDYLYSVMLKSIGDSTGGPEGAQAPLLKNKFLKILGKGCSID